jgi:mannan endo-1,4-beta-mannosidase
MKRRFVPVMLLVLLAGCAGGSKGPRPVNPDATPLTVSVLQHLEKVRHEKVLFGHQDDLAYGVTWKAEAGRSDVNETAGAYPAVFGWEIGDLERDSTYNLDRVVFTDMQRWIKEAHALGGINTISWHMDNPATDGSSWDTVRAVPVILPGGAKHAQFLSWLDRFAAFNEALVDEKGRAIPVIFRPWHENTGGWFWWGRTHCSPEEYKALYRFTFDYLTNVKKQHNLLWAWSPAEKHLDEFEQWYPGNDVVDIIGVDDYGSWYRENAVETMSANLRTLVERAEARGKIPVLAETGFEALKEERWFTEKLLAALKADPAAKRIAYVLVWRNANAATDRPDHFYAPYAGHASEADFKAFRNDPLLFFAGDGPLF